MQLNLLKGNSMKETTKEFCHEIFDSKTETLYTTTGEGTNNSCNGCAGQYDTRLCEAFIDTVSCSSEQVIWIKSEKKEAPEAVLTFTPSLSEKITFSSEQIKYLQQVFQIDVSQEVLPVKDGFVKKSDMVWWLGEFGPEEVLAEKEWSNIKGYPDAYSVKEPKYKIVYED